MTGFAMTAEGAQNPMLAQNPMRATSNRNEVRRATQGAPGALSLPAGPGAGQGAEFSQDGYPGTTGHSATPGQALVEQPRGPQLSEQLDMLSEVLADRRLADLERRGLFLHPEVF